MFQILVVDDEKEIRDGLRAWPWEKLRVRAAGSCSNGFEALQFLSSHPVDIVMTDIRMPFLDGLGLMKVLSEQYPYISVVVLSGYNDFDYARKAMQFGAVDYLLKPIDFAEMERCVRRQVARLEQRESEEQRLVALKLKTQKLGRTLRAIFLSNLFRGALPDDLEQSAAEAEVILGKGDYTAACLRMDRFRAGRGGLSKEEADFLAFTLDSVLTAKWDEAGGAYHLVDRTVPGADLLAKGRPDAEKCEAIRRELLAYRGLFRSTFTVTAGPAVPGAELLCRSLQKAKEKTENQPPNSLFLFPPDDALPGEAGARRIGAAAEEENPPPEAGNSALAQAKLYIQKNYGLSLSLRDVAEKVYISPGYLSALFKRSGETFLKYLTDVRMKRAQELMPDRRYYIYEVMEKVGYTDPAYFSELFKRQTGMTPNEYRNRKAGEGG